MKGIPTGKEVKLYLFVYDMMFYIQEYLGDIVSSVPDYHNKSYIATKESHKFFDFSVRIKFMSTLYCILLSVQQH